MATGKLFTKQSWHFSDQQSQSITFHMHTLKQTINCTVCGFWMHTKNQENYYRIYFYRRRFQSWIMHCHIALSSILSSRANGPDAYPKASDTHFTHAFTVELVLFSVINVVLSFYLAKLLPYASVYLYTSSIIFGPHSLDSTHSVCFFLLSLQIHSHLIYSNSFFFACVFF